MFNGTIRKVPPFIKTVAVVGLAVGLGVWAKAQTQEESFEERLRKAAEAQTRKNQADEAEQKNLAAAFAIKREALQKHEEADLRQSELAFEQKMELRKHEQATQLRELEARLKGNEEQLAQAVADVNTRMLAKDADAESAFAQDREAFRQKLAEKVATELAKPEAERERRKQIALSLVMTYFTGGAALPALAAAGSEGMSRREVAPA